MTSWSGATVAEQVRVRVQVLIGVPSVVRNKALAAGAVRWLDELPSLVASLEREWSIVVGRPFGDATEALVAEVTLDHGSRGKTPRIPPSCESGPDATAVGG